MKPPQSGKYTAPSTTAGVADTSPCVVNFHFSARFFALSGLIVDEPDRVSAMFWAAHRPSEHDLG